MEGDRTMTCPRWIRTLVVMVTVFAFGSAMVLVGHPPAPLHAQSVPTPTAPPCSPNCYLVGDTVWLDVNRNGIQDHGEPGIQGVTIHVYTSDPTGAIGQPTVWWTQTDINGHYQVEPEQGHWYMLQFTLPSTSMTFTNQNVGSDDTKDSDVYEPPSPNTGFTESFLLNNQIDHSKRWDAGVFDPTGCRFIGNTIWRDMNNNGTLEGTDQRMTGVKVSLLRKDYAIPLPPYEMFKFVAYDFTDGTGGYRFSCLAEDEYAVLVESLGSYVVNPTNEDDVNNGIDLDNNLLLDPALDIWPGLTVPIGGATKQINLTGGHQNPDYTIDGSFICSDQKFDVIFVIDRSGSMKDTDKDGNVKFDKARQAALDFVAQMDLEGGNQKAGLVLFGTKVNFWEGNAVLEQPLTSDRSAITNKITNSSWKSVNTDISAGIDVAAQELKGPNRTPGSQPIMILLTDGVPNEGRDVIEAAKDAKKVEGLHLIVIGLGKNVDESLLRRVATNPADYYYAPTGNDLVDVFHDIITDVCRRATGQLAAACTSQGGTSTTIDLSTGAKRSGAQDAEWTVDPYGPAGNGPASVVDNPHPVWRKNKLPGSSEWISHRSDAKSRDGTPAGNQQCVNDASRLDMYEYTRTFELEGSPAQVELELFGVADDHIDRIELNGNLLEPSFGGAFSQRPIHVFDDDASKYHTGVNALKVYVRDTGCFMEGLDTGVWTNPGPTAQA